MRESQPVPRPHSTSDAGRFEDTPTVSPQVRQCRSIRPHRTRGSEVAALAFAPPHAIPAQRRPDSAESHPAS